MLVSNNEKYLLKVYHKKPNSPYEYEPNCAFTFKGRPAGQEEIKKYRIQAGVNGNTDSVYILTSNCRGGEINVGDRIEFRGKIWTVQSRGYYYDEARFINPGIMSDEFISKKCPKGINIG